MTEKQAFAKVLWMRKSLGAHTPFVVLRHATQLDAKDRPIFAACADFPAQQELVADLIAQGFVRHATFTPCDACEGTARTLAYPLLQIVLRQIHGCPS